MNEDVVHIYNGIVLSHKKNEIMPFSATWLDVEIIILREVSQKKKDNTVWYHLHMESYCHANEFIDERETDSQT